MLTASVLICNTGSKIVYAEDNNSTGTTESTTESANSTSENSSSTLGASGEWVPRFPVGRGGNLSGLSSGNTPGGKIDDADWVAHKDDARHGITIDSALWNSAMLNAGIGVGHLGQAKGTYAVQVGGKSYYWYHQGNCGCINCGTWSNMQWGGGGTLSNDGCAIYSLSIIASNLLGQEITPSKLLTDMGCVINESNTSCDTGPSKYINGHSLAAGEEGIGQFMCEQYGLEMEALSSLSKADCKKRVDEILDSGGMIWYRYTGGSWSPWKTSSHFIPIRERDEKGYYILDEVNKPESGINDKPISFDAIYNEKYSNTAYFVGFWVGNGTPKKDNNSSDSNTNSSDNKKEDNDDKQETTTKNNSTENKPSNKNITNSSTGNNSAYSMWAGPATQLKQYSNKVDLGDGFYLYDGLPWAADANTFAIDVDTATIAVEQYVKQTSGDNVAKCKFQYMQGSDGNYSSIELLKSNTCRMSNQVFRPDSGQWTSKGGGLCTDRDGIQCIGVGVGPALTDWDYNVDFGGNEGKGLDDKNRWAIDYDNRNQIFNDKSAIVLYEIDTKKLWYLPAAACSAKGHAFPGGLIQTGNSLSSHWHATPCTLDSNGLPTDFDVHRAGEGYDWSHHKTGSIKEIMDLMNFTSSATQGYSCWDVTYSVFECWNLPTSVDSKIVDSGDYVAVGWVHWPIED